MKKASAMLARELLWRKLLSHLMPLNLKRGNLVRQKILEKNYLFKGVLNEKKITLKHGDRYISAISHGTKLKSCLF